MDPGTIDPAATISGNGVMAVPETVNDARRQIPHHGVTTDRGNGHDATPRRQKSAIPEPDVFTDMKRGDDRTKPLDQVVVMTEIANDDQHLVPERTRWAAAPDRVLVLSNGLQNGIGRIQAAENAAPGDDQTAGQRRSSGRVRSVIAPWIPTSETESFSGIVSGNVTVPERNNPGRLVGDAQQEHRGHSEIVAESTSLGCRIRS